MPARAPVLEVNRNNREDASDVEMRDARRYRLLRHRSCVRNTKEWSYPRGGWSIRDGKPRAGRASEFESAWSGRVSDLAVAGKQRMANSGAVKPIPGAAGVAG
jgi:hypothetical protein